MGSTVLAAIWLVLDYVCVSLKELIKLFAIVAFALGLTPFYRTWKLAILSNIGHRDPLYKLRAFK